MKTARAKCSTSSFQGSLRLAGYVVTAANGSLFITPIRSGNSPADGEIRCYQQRNVHSRYISCIWSPHHILKMQQVETVQRKFTKRLPGYALLCYQVTSSRIELEILEMHRLQHDLLCTYKIVFNLVSGAAKLMIFSRLLTHFIQLEHRGHAEQFYRCK